MGARWRSLDVRVVGVRLRGRVVRGCVDGPARGWWAERRWCGSWRESLGAVGVFRVGRGVAGGRAARAWGPTVVGRQSLGVVGVSRVRFAGVVGGGGCDLGGVSRELAVGDAAGELACVGGPGRWCRQSLAAWPWPGCRWRGELSVVVGGRGGWPGSRWQSRWGRRGARCSELHCNEYIESLVRWFKHRVEDPEVAGSSPGEDTFWVCCGLPGGQGQQSLGSGGAVCGRPGGRWGTAPGGRRVCGTVVGVRYSSALVGRGRRRARWRVWGSWSLGGEPLGPAEAGRAFEAVGRRAVLACVGLRRRGGAGRLGLWGLEARQGSAGRGVLGSAGLVVRRASVFGGGRRPVGRCGGRRFTGCLGVRRGSDRAQGECRVWCGARGGQARPRADGRGMPRRYGEWWRRAGCGGGAGGWRAARRPGGRRAGGRRRRGPVGVLRPCVRAAGWRHSCAGDSLDGRGVGQRWPRAGPHERRWRAGPAGCRGSHAGEAGPSESRRGHCPRHIQTARRTGARWRSCAVAPAPLPTSAPPPSPPTAAWPTPPAGAHRRPRLPPDRKGPRPPSPHRRSLDVA